MIGGQQPDRSAVTRHDGFHDRTQAFGAFLEGKCAVVGGREVSRRDRGVTRQAVTSCALVNGSTA
jgi:hypothetical protein